MIRCSIFGRFARSLTLFLFIPFAVSGQQSGTLYVGGSLNTFYPVSFTDGAWELHRATDLKIGRSGVHLDSEWRGGFLADFQYHVTSWGNGSAFIDASIVQGPPHGEDEFIAGWRDVSITSHDKKIIIWLRGGGTTYNYSSSVNVSPVVYDGVANALPYQETNGPTHGVLTEVQDYVHVNGRSLTHQLQVNGLGTNVIKGSLGIGTNDTKGYKLAVNGDAVFTKIKVKQYAQWPDYVFDSTYSLISLDSLEHFVVENGHLPGVPSSSEVDKKGIDLGEMNAILLKKIEELTLYIMMLEKKVNRIDRFHEIKSDKLIQKKKKNEVLR